MGGCAAPDPGRSPGGARKSAMNPASSNIPSDRYPENSPAALTNERKERKQTNNAPRGHTLSTTRAEAAIPIQHTVINMCELVDTQNKVGAFQKRPCPADSVTARRYSPAGKIPAGPINP